MENFDQVAEKESLTASIASSFNDPTSFPDLTVILGNHKWVCHKLILSRQSEWFLKACSGGFKEGGAAEIEVHENNHRVFGAALQYCYTLEVDSKLSEGHEDMSVGLFWVRLFATAEFYMIKGLDSLAVDRVIKAINPGDGTDTPEYLADLFHQVYTTTTDSKRLLRDAVMKKTLEYPGVYLAGESACFNDFMKAEPEFAVDMLNALAKSHPSKPSTTTSTYGFMESRYRCPQLGCRYTFPREWEPVEEDVMIKYEPVEENVMIGKFCISCSFEYRHTRAQWRRYQL